MIRLTRLNGDQFFLNADLIQTIEAMPDTHITLSNGHQYVALENADMVAEAAIAYQRRVRSGRPALLKPVERANR